MICRRNKKTEKGSYTLVWFGSYGKNEDYILLTEEPSDFNYAYFKYYKIDSITQNTSPIFDYSKKYYKLIDNNYIFVEQKPDDWDIEWKTYFFIESSVAENNHFGGGVYYLHNNAKFFNKDNKHDNYSIEQEGVKDSLIQRLSVLKGELWYKNSYGLPLTDKIKNKGIYDSIIINIINSHPDVKNIISFHSKIENHKYCMTFIVNTIYNQKIEISTLV